MLYVHTVHFWKKSGVAESDVERAIGILRDLAHACGGECAGILSHAVGPNLDRRKPTAPDFGQTTIFSDADAFQRWRKHPAHVTAVEILSDVADWQACDFEI